MHTRDVRDIWRVWGDRDRSPGLNWSPSLWFGSVSHDLPLEAIHYPSCTATGIARLSVDSLYIGRST